MIPDFDKSYNPTSKGYKIDLPKTTFTYCRISRNLVKLRSTLFKLVNLRKIVQNDDIKEALFQSPHISLAL